MCVGSVYPVPPRCFGTCGSSTPELDPLIPTQMSGTLSDVGYGGGAPRMDRGRGEGVHDRQSPTTAGVTEPRHPDGSLGEKSSDNPRITAGEDFKEESGGAQNAGESSSLPELRIGFEVWPFGCAELSCRPALPPPAIVTPASSAFAPNIFLSKAGLCQRTGGSGRVGCNLRLWSTGASEPGPDNVHVQRSLSRWRAICLQKPRASGLWV